MSYTRNKPKAKKRKYYRFEGRQLSEVPADIDWELLIKEKHVKQEWLEKWPYWFQRGTKQQLRRTKDIEEEARAVRSHQTFTKRAEKKVSWIKSLLIKFVNPLKTKRWQLSSARP